MAVSCSPREGCGLHPHFKPCAELLMIVAVPVRGAGCIVCDIDEEIDRLDVAVPVRGRVASGRAQGTVSPAFVAVPVRGAGCIRWKTCCIGF